MRFARERGAPRDRVFRGLCLAWSLTVVIVRQRLMVSRRLGGPGVSCRVGPASLEQSERAPPAQAAQAWGPTAPVRALHVGLLRGTDTGPTAG